MMILMQKRRSKNEKKIRRKYKRKAESCSGGKRDKVPLTIFLSLVSFARQTPSEVVTLLSNFTCLDNLY